MAPLIAWTIGAWLEVPFHRCANRALLIAAILMVIPLVLSRHRLPIGFNGPPGWAARMLLGGLASGVLTYGTVAVIHLLHGARLPNPKADLLGVLVTAIASGAAIGLIEEFLFRGVIQQDLVRRLGPITGLTTASVFYAFVHFVKTPGTFRPDPVTWTSGFDAVGKALAPLAESETWLSWRMLNLVLTGGVLGVIYLRSGGSLWLPIGLHAGWVGTLLSTNKLTTPGSPDNIWLSPGDPVASPLTSLMLALLIWGAWSFSPSPRQPSSAT
jgi:hypothetical protein